MKRVAIWAGIILVILAIGALVVLLVLAGRAAAEYETTVQRAARGLEGDFTALADTTYKGVIDDPDQPADRTQRDIASIKEITARTRRDLATLDVASRTMKPMPLTNMSLQYRNALVLRGKTQSTIRQVNEALTSYEALASFIAAYMHARTALQTELNHLNVTSDFNDFAGQGDVFRAAAARLRNASGEFGRVAAPAAMAPLQQNMTNLLNRSATEFEDLGYGYDVAVDDLIYGPIHKIETITAEFDEQSRTLYVPALQNMRTVNEIRDLSEKLDPLMEPLL